MVCRTLPRNTHRNMEYHPLGRSGLRIPRLGLGTWLSLADPRSDAPDAMIGAAIDAGIRFFDTADIYDFGEAEELLGKSLAGYSRDSLVIATKLYFPMSEDPNDCGLSRKHLLQSVNQSLRRLRIDFIDLYQCHRYDEQTPLEETVATMGELIARGKILYWGTSMWSGAQLRDACALCDALGVPRPISEQARYNLLCREVEPEVVPTAAELGVGFLWWSPLAQGVLTGKYHQGAAAPDDTRAASTRRQGSFLDAALADPEVHARVTRFGQVAADAGVEMDALALAWCLEKQPGSTALIGVRNRQQLERNLAALQVDWSGGLLEAVEAATAGPTLDL